MSNYFDESKADLLPGVAHVGAAGEAWVESALMRQGYSVARAQSHLPRVDMLARRPGARWVEIQVKATMSGRPVPVVRESHVGDNPPEFYIFVHFPTHDPLAEPQAYVVPGTVVVHSLSVPDSTPYITGREKRRYILWEDPQLRDYLAAWHLLPGHPAAPITGPLVGDPVDPPEPAGA